MKRIALLSVFVLLAVIACGEDKPRSPLSPVVMAGNPSADLDQCANGPDVTAPITCSGSAWQNGNLNANQAHYLEGDSPPYRLLFSNLSSGTHTVTIGFDVTQSGKHAIDYLTTFDRTEHQSPDANPDHGNNPCSGVSGCSLTAFTTFDIPIDAKVTAGEDGSPGTGDDITQIAGVFTLFNGAITAVSGYTRSGKPSGDTTASITITFTTNVSNPVLAWSGHISTRKDWGVAHSAISINGSPYHTRLLDLDGSGGNQDRSLEAAAVTFPAMLTIIKQAVPQDPQDFGFTTTGPELSGFSLDDDLDPTLPNTQTFSLTLFGSTNTRTITETNPAPAFLLTGLTCTEDPGGLPQTDNSSVSLGTRTATIIAEEGEIITCTFTNTKQPVLKVQKATVPPDDPGKFDFTIGATSFDNGGIGYGNDEATAFQVVSVGANSISEAGHTGTSLGDYTSAVSCLNVQNNPVTVSNNTGTSGSVTLAAGDRVICTFTNTRKTGTLEVKKALVPTTDPGLFTLDLDGGTPEKTDAGNGGTTGAVTVNTGTHSVSEVAGTGTLLSDYNSGISCTDGTTGTGTSLSGITVNEGDAVVCTITNTRKTGTLEIIKKTTGGDGGPFAFAVTGPTASTTSLTTSSGSATTGAVTVNTGTYTVQETSLPTGWSLTSADCNDGSSSFDLTTRTVSSVVVASGSAVVCTFNNTVVVQLGKTRGFWGNNNGHAILDPDRNGLINNPVTIGGDPRSASVTTILQSDKILGGNACTIGFPTIFTCTGTGTGEGLSDALKVATLNTLAAQTLALTYNIQKITNYGGQTIQALSCAPVSGLTLTSTVDQVLVQANLLIQTSVSTGGSTTQQAAGAMNTLLGCLNREL